MSENSATPTRTREEWLLNLVGALRADFERLGFPVPDVKVSTGWPSKLALSQKKRRIGECWAAEAAKDKVCQIFISPYLSDPLRVAETLVHELGHACVGLDAGHGAPFKRFMKTVGLVGKATATEAGDELKERLQRVLTTIGDYPHAMLDKLTRPGKKQTTRMHKAVCPNCGYTVRVAKKWIDIGLPTCPCGEEMAADEGDDDNEDE